MSPVTGPALVRGADPSFPDRPAAGGRERRARVSRRLWAAALALLPWAAVAWAAWLSYCARVWAPGSGAAVGPAAQTWQYFLLLTMAALAGASLGTGWRLWAAVPWLVLGLPLLAVISFFTVPVLDHGGQMITFATRWGLGFYAAGLVVAAAAGFLGRGRRGLLIRAAAALASLALFAAVLAAGAWRAVSPTQQLGARLVVERDRVGPRPGVPWVIEEPSAAGPAGGRVFFMDSRGSLFEVRPGRHPWLAERRGLLPLPPVAELERALGPGWRLQQPCTYVFAGAKSLGPSRPGCARVVYRVLVMPASPALGGHDIGVMATLDLDRGRALSCEILSPVEDAAWDTPRTLIVQSGPFEVTANKNYTMEVKGPGVLTRVRSRRTSTWDWAWAQGRLAMAGAENGEVVAVVLPGQ